MEACVFVKHNEIRMYSFFLLTENDFEIVKSTFKVLTIFFLLLNRISHEKIFIRVTVHQKLNILYTKSFSLSRIIIQLHLIIRTSDCNFE